MPAHLLIVDDDERIRGLLQRFLKRQRVPGQRRARRGACAALLSGWIST
jgi:DNA-binding NtrC family response regulator